MTEIKVLYSEFPEPMETEIYHYYLNQLPDILKSKNGRYRRWQDRHTHLFGKMLLKHLARRYGLENQVLDQLSYTKHDRPYLEGPIDFNISHTGTTVACAITEGAKIGLDIELYNEVDFSDFRRIHNADLWDQIKTSEDPKKAFFEFWTIKESVIKADGKGLSIPLEEIKIDHDQAIQGDRLWHLKRLHLEEYMACCVACDQQDFNVSVEKISGEQL